MRGSGLLLAPSRHLPRQPLRRLFGAVRGRVQFPRQLRGGLERVPEGAAAGPQLTGVHETFLRLAKWVIRLFFPSLFVSLCLVFALCYLSHFCYLDPLSSIFLQLCILSFVSSHYLVTVLSLAFSCLWILRRGIEPHSKAFGYLWQRSHLRNVCIRQETDTKGLKIVE